MKPGAVHTELQQFTCVRCRSAQRATRFSWLGAPEPPFRYALSEVVFQFLKHNGQLPLTASYDHFVVGRGRERRTFDVAFELELTPSDGERGEHDIIATWGADLWIGEATAEAGFGTAKFERKRLQRLARVADALSVRGVLLVTESACFSTRTKENVTRAFPDSSWPEVVYVEGFSAGAERPVEE